MEEGRGCGNYGDDHPHPTFFSLLAENTSFRYGIWDDIENQLQPILAPSAPPPPVYASSLTHSHIHTFTHTVKEIVEPRQLHYGRLLFYFAIIFVFW